MTGCPELEERIVGGQADIHRDAELTGHALVGDHQQAAGVR